MIISCQELTLDHFVCILDLVCSVAAGITTQSMFHLYQALHGLQPLASDPTELQDAWQNVCLLFRLCDTGLPALEHRNAAVSKKLSFAT